MTVYNKCDLTGGNLQPAERHTVRISALNGVGIPALLQEVADVLPGGTAKIGVLLPYRESALAALLHEKGRVFEERYEEDGVFVSAEIDRTLLYRFLPYLK